MKNGNNIITELGEGFHYILRPYDSESIEVEWVNKTNMAYKVWYRKKDINSDTIPLLKLNRTLTRHRLDGPAQINKVKTDIFYCIDGNEYSEDEYWKHPKVIAHKLSKHNLLKEELKLITELISKI